MIRLLGLTTSFLCLGLACTPSSNEYVAPPPPKVTVARPVQQDVTLFIQENGQTEPVEEAEVRARVRGFIEQITFEAAQKVSRGDPLYRIEKDQYEADREAALAALAAANANVSIAIANQEKAAAEVTQSQADYDRKSELVRNKVISQAEFELALSTRDSAAANLAAAKANLEAAQAQIKTVAAALKQAELNLGYTEVTAPISGRVSKTFVKLGNLVNNGDELARVISDDHIYVNFSISDRMLLRLMGNRASKDERHDRQWRNFPVFVKTERQQAGWLEGRLDYIDQEGVDQETGTFALRGVFDNSAGELVPGLFVQVRLPVAQKQSALLIPLLAVQKSQLGDFVLVVDSNNMVERRSIALGEEIEQWVLVSDGLTAEEAIIIDGILRARPGTEVEPVMRELHAEATGLLNVDLPDLNGQADAGKETLESEPE